VPDPIVDELRRLAGPELYRRNAFRISGLLADVDGRTTRQVSQRLRAALEMGADVDLGTATSRDPDEIQAACDLILGDPRRRLVHEVFAPWGTDVSDCGCPVELHKTHDTAVNAHSTAISRELTADAGQVSPDGDWTRARQNWSKVVGTKALATHLESRVRDLDDRQLDREAVKEIQRELPRALAQPAVDLAVSGPTPRAVRLVSHAGAFPGAQSLHRRMLETAATPLYEDLERRRTEIAQRIGDEPTDPIVDEIESELLPLLARLDALLPPAQNHRTSALHDQVAILLNNCAVDLMNRGDAGDGRAERWLDRAASLALDQQERDLVRENREMLEENQRSMQEFRKQVDYLYRMRGKYAAQRLLRQVRGETRSTAIRAEIDRMLAAISAGRSPLSQHTHLATPRRQPKPAKPVRPRTPQQRRRRRLVAWLIVLALIAFGVWHWWPRNANLYHQKIADNSAAGSCLGKQDNGWTAHPDKLHPSDCDDPHWGEVLAYVPISKIPAPYPGDAQAAALAHWQCGEALIQQGLNPAEYDVDEVHAPAEFWNTTSNPSGYENYAACIVRRHDGAEIPSGRVTRPDAKKVPKPVTMNLFAVDIAGNAPVGACLRDPIRGELTKPVVVVRCSEWHWAEIRGYPTLYRVGQPWPGDNAVVARAQTVCARTMPAAKGFTAWAGSPDRTWWKDPKQTKYAYCLVHRIDGKPFKGAVK
jgi:hypothetical protein